MTESLAPASMAPDPSPGQGAPGGGRGAARARRGGLLAAGALAALAAGACGGKVVVDGFAPEGAGGAGAASSAVSSAAVTSASSSGAGGDPGEGGAPPIAPLVEEDFGEVAFGVPVGVELPPGTLGFTAIAELPSSPSTFDVIGIEQIVGPSGRLHAADYSLPGTWALFYNYGIGTAAVPQTGTDAAVPFVPGTYWITLGDGGTGVAPRSARLKVWRRQTLDGRFHGGRIDVNAFIAGNAVSEEYLESALRTAYHGFVGLRIGQITFHRLGREWAYVDEAVVPLLLEQTAGAPGRPALNVIAVSAFGGEIANASGVTPSVPAVAVQHGTHLSGIVVSLFGEPTADTVILRHELGHFAGLFHTTEFEPDFGDPLDDTLRCDDVMSKLESCPDYDNIMFPTGGDFSARMTPQQRTVVQASTFYRGIVEDGGGAADPLPTDPGTPARGSRSSPPTGGDAPAPGHGHGAWAAALPPRAATLLAGHFCGHSAAAGADFFALLRAAGGADLAPLLAVGRDPAAPVQVRARALAAAGRAAAELHVAAPAARAVADLQALAADPRQPRGARLGAIQGVASASPAAARALAARLVADPDDVVERVALRAAR
ncbi:hypothetical protein [Sorangium sp. So ce131]|uniref:hypothetical protein n=1 Tax=Sorangium sp. So ce131 TaxID=3133282 RepID=UPI003F628ACB